jgi:putative ABC transport system permease protein
MTLPTFISSPRSPLRRTSGVSEAALLARRNLVADPLRLARSIAGIGFAVLLMMLQLGFRDGYIESMLLMMRRLDGDIMLVNSQMYQFERATAFPRRQLAAARGAPGVASARPFYIERVRGIWRNPRDHRLHAVPVFAFDPDQPVLRLPEVSEGLAALRQPDTIMFDRNARTDLGVAPAGTRTELARRAVRVVGTFWLGPNFFNDGDIVTSDRNFFTFFGGGGPKHDYPPDPEVGVIKVLDGHDVGSVLKALRAEMPAGVSVLTKQEMLDQEARLHARYSPVGPVFNVGALVGFLVGMLISYQILFTEISDQLPQYATLKAIGYTTRYLATVVLQQAAFYALVAYIPAWLLCTALLRVIAYLTVSPTEMTLSLTLTTLALTLTMCVASGLVAVRKVVLADPAEIF